MQVNCPGHSELPYFFLSANSALAWVQEFPAEEAPNISFNRLFPGLRTKPLSAEADPAMRISTP